MGVCQNLGHPPPSGPQLVTVAHADVSPDPSETSGEELGTAISLNVPASPSCALESNQASEHTVPIPVERMQPADAVQSIQHEYRPSTPPEVVSTRQQSRSRATSVGSQVNDRETPPVWTKARTVGVPAFGVRNSVMAVSPGLDPLDENEADQNLAQQPHPFGISPRDKVRTLAKKCS